MAEGSGAAHRIGGRYELGELLGRGGMAEVRKGTDVRLGRTVAVKRLRTDLASDQTFQARFRREAQSAASLNHPAIGSVYDTGEEVAEEGGHPVAQPYIVMEYVAGRTLRDILREGRKILPERALEITAGVLSALDYSHRAGIIHRDIKPGNVMLTPAGDVKVMDFGIARAVSDAQSTMTQTAAVVGTAQYLSPEQARGETVDSRSDVYSTGCLLYELLTGRPPFVGDSPVAFAYQHVREVAPPPSALDEDLSPEIDAIVMKALAKNLNERYQSAAAMKADIDRYLAGRPVQAPLVAASDDATKFIPASGAALAGPGTGQHTAVTPVVAGAEEEEPERKRRAGPLILLSLLIALLLAGAVYAGLQLFNDGPEVQQVSVPQLTGKTEAQAKRLLDRAGLQVGEVSEENSDEVEQGRVISQDPGATEQIEEGSAVDFVVSLGPADVTIPDVIGDNRETARATLEELGLQVRFESRFDDAPENDVIAVDPPVGTDVAHGSRVTLTFSKGPRKIPDVVGMPEDRARSALKDAGFEVDAVPDGESEEPKGTVTRQSPPAGTAQPSGTTVTIFVSTFEPSPTPSPTPSDESPSASPTETPTETPTDEGDDESRLPVG
jgi:serine/threonine-protein kinase